MLFLSENASRKMKDRVIAELEESIAVKERLKDYAETLLSIANDAFETLKNGGKIVFFGNGGSAADAQHLAAEFVGKLQTDRKGMPAIAFTTNTSILTAVSNDWSFEEIFARQVEALVNEGDLVIGISTGGNSKNVIRGIEEAHKKGAKTVGLIGKGGGMLAKLAQKSIVVPSNNTQRIQEAHITIGHILCGIIEDRFVGSRSTSSTRASK